MAFETTPCETTRQPLEVVADGDVTLAIIVRADYRPESTAFLTQPDALQQMGFITYPQGSEIPRHDHRPIERSIRGTSECLIVREGRTEMTLYNERREEVCRRELATGDVVLLVAGGHGFRQIEDTVLLEIKQGPYPGPEEKERF